MAASRSKSSRSKRPHMSEEELRAYLERTGQEKSPLAEVLGGWGIPQEVAPRSVALRSPADGAGASNALGLALPPAKKKRRGVEVKPITDSLKDPDIRVAADPGAAGRPAVFAMWFGGARALTVNELFSILQVRHHVIYPYKKAWRKLVDRAVAMVPPGSRPFFNGPTLLTLYRRGAKGMDLDSLSTVFKYALDALRHNGIISDDNPQVVVDIAPRQTVGEPALGLRLEQLPHWQPMPEGWEPDWFDAPVQAASPARPRKGTRPAA